jgi:DNA-binding transcriptional ArsR family regulator
MPDRAADPTVTADAEACDLLCLDLPKAEALRRALPTPDALEAWAAQGRALADPTRLAIVLALRDGGECCVCDVAWVVGKDEKLVSHHLRLLKGSGVARSHRDGRMVIYELTGAGRALVDAFAASQGARA